MLSDGEIRGKLVSLRGWQLEGNVIAKEYVFGGFAEAARFINRVAPIADKMDHHPDLQLYKYKILKVILTTHSVGGLTQNDFDLAAKIDSLATNRQGTQNSESFL